MSVRSEKQGATFKIDGKYRTVFKEDHPGEYDRDVIIIAIRQLIADDV